MIYRTTVPLAKPHRLMDLTLLNGFISGGPPPGSDPTTRLLYSPNDQIHEALCFVLDSALTSLVVAMYGFDDEELATIVKAKLEDPSIYVQLTLDSSQAGGVHEKALLAQENYPNSSIAVGESEKGAIMHLKQAVIDASVVIHGSTNWSTGGESLQDNELYVTINPGEAARATTKIAAIHTHMLQAKGNQP